MLVLIALLTACEPVTATVDSTDDALVASDLVVYAIRHMERDSTPGVQDPELTDVGASRAETLAAFLADVEIAAAYSTPFNRTVQTIQPTADANGIEIDTNWEDMAGLAAHILANHDNQEVIAAGHSNTVPPLIAGLGAEAPVINSYGELWVVTVTDGVATAALTPFE